MKTLFIASTKHLLLALAYGVLGITITAIASIIWLLNSRQDLSLWHTTKLTAEFNQEMQLKGFSDYLALEDKLFAEVEDKVYQKTQALTHQPLNRYVRGSLSDPKKWSKDWNRSFEWKNPRAEYGLLLLHGMSDSPYSMSHLASHFRSSAYVLGLRLPGHGTLPSELINLQWQDMAQAVAIATQYMRQQLQGKPLYVMAFSTGAALALNHELEALKQDKPLSYDGLVFISPAIGLSPVAAGAKWQSHLGQLLGLEKLSWNAIQTEYDPFKYNSFAVNAGDVVYQLAARNQQLLDQLTVEQVSQLADILTFQSLADNTVSTPSVLTGLYQRLPRSDQQLVLFDLNRVDVNMSLVVHDPMDAIKPLLLPALLQYDLTLVQNQHDQGQSLRSIEAVHFHSDDKPRHEPLNLMWPAEVYSLSHVALPFPESDSLYGPKKNSAQRHHRINIGSSATRGERGVLGVPAADVLRQKWNPFYPYMLTRMEQFIADRQAK
ncbi:alpha/beta fold hydrolase [Shewanella sp. Isolate11]|uniref:alpha/beta hydrolase n=1 Tax=Shewanella sp. Isolate11 TaxID=2908530 RepID=UPI001EFD6390|nr:alpha/beta fold hydrolase [Shewanella sp. Isolate11]MCG9698354.1 alpha/beta fold hydrolase [Shewanella sp. Isolate11]